MKQFRFTRVIHKSSGTFPSSSAKRAALARRACLRHVCWLGRAGVTPGAAPRTSLFITRGACPGRRAILWRVRRLGRACLRPLTWKRFLSIRELKNKNGSGGKSQESFLMDNRPTHSGQPGLHEEGLKLVTRRPTNKGQSRRPKHLSSNDPRTNLFRSIWKTSVP